MTDIDRRRGRSQRGLGSSFFHEIRRAWRRLDRRFTGSGVATVYHDNYEHSLGIVPLDPERATKILAFLTEEGLVEPDDLWIARAPAASSP